MSSPFTARVPGRHTALRFFEGIARTTLIGALALSDNAFAADPKLTLASAPTRRGGGSKPGRKLRSQHAHQCDLASHRITEVLLSVAKLTRSEFSRAKQIF